MVLKQALLVAAVVGVISGCSASKVSNERPTHESRALSGSQLKPSLTGLLEMGAIAFHRADGGLASNNLDNANRFPGVLGGIVINITWQQLESERGKIVTIEIDGFLNEIRAYNKVNASHPYRREAARVAGTQCASVGEEPGRRARIRPASRRSDHRRSILEQVLSRGLA